MTDKPRYTHDCQNCVFIGQHEDRDLYLCSHARPFPTVISRWGSNGCEYNSGFMLAVEQLMGYTDWFQPTRAHDALGEALRRLILAGMVSYKEGNTDAGRADALATELEIRRKQRDSAEVNAVKEKTRADESRALLAESEKQLQYRDATIARETARADAAEAVGIANKQWIEARDELSAARTERHAAESELAAIDAELAGRLALQGMSRLDRIKDLCRSAGAHETAETRRADAAEARVRELMDANHDGNAEFRRTALLADARKLAETVKATTMPNEPYGLMAREFLARLDALAEPEPLRDVVKLLADGLESDDEDCAAPFEPPTCHICNGTGNAAGDEPCPGCRGVGRLPITEEGMRAAAKDDFDAVLDKAAKVIEQVRESVRRSRGKDASK